VRADICNWASGMPVHRMSPELCFFIAADNVPLRLIDRPEGGTSGALPATFTLK
jgi:hypothetical protein